MPDLLPRHLSTSAPETPPSPGPTPRPLPRLAGSVRRPQRCHNGTHTRRGARSRSGRLRATPVLVAEGVRRVNKGDVVDEREIRGTINQLVEAWVDLDAAQERLAAFTKSNDPPPLPGI